MLLKFFLRSQRRISFFLLDRSIKICTLLSPSADSAALEIFIPASLFLVWCVEERLWRQRAYTFSIGIVPVKLPSKQNIHTDLHFPWKDRKLLIYPPPLSQYWNSVYCQPDGQIMTWYRVSGSTMDFSGLLDISISWLVSSVFPVLFDFVLLVFGRCHIFVCLLHRPFPHSLLCFLLWLPSDILLFISLLPALRAPLE